MNRRLSSYRAARIYAGNLPAAILYAMGITQHTCGHQNVLAVANLAMVTGNIGIPGSGVNPLRGQNNVQGACDMGGLPNVYSGYQPVSDPKAREKFEKAWGRVPASDKPGLTVTEMLGAAERGQIRGLWIMGENAAMSDPDAHHVAEALKRTEFLVCQDIFLNETAQFAHVVLPAASFAEKDGTFTITRSGRWPSSRALTTRQRDFRTTISRSPNSRNANGNSIAWIATQPVR